MRIERVDGNRRIKVLLTQNDLSEMNINIRTLTSDSPELHSFLFKVMDFIKEETGFNVASGQIVVEAAPANDGVILTVTKILPEKKQKKLKPQNVRVKKATTAKRIFRFESFDALSDYLTIAKSEQLEKTELFKLGDMFYAITKEQDINISEFAQSLPPVGTDNLFFSEHGTKLADGNSLIKMANELKKLK